MNLPYWYIWLLFAILALAFRPTDEVSLIAVNQTALPESPILANQTGLVNPTGATIQTRFLLPEGFQRIQTEENSFANYLQHLPLKPHGSHVEYYNGELKIANGVYAGVVNMDIGKRDLQQCADAIMRLRGEYLWQQKMYDQIHFDFTNGQQVDYAKWKEGYRMRIKGNKTTWYKATAPSNNYEDFRKYMDLIFAYAGTLSLSKELQSIPFEEMQIGDVFIQGGSPGHAVVIVDMAKHPETGKQLFLLAQSYMPAQDIQILQNGMNESFSPWYSNQFFGDLITPEWRFQRTDLKRFY